MHYFILMSLILYRVLIVLKIYKKIGKKPFYYYTISIIIVETQKRGGV
jgi:hypothetical protein